MKDYATDAIRNVALISHGGGGKTSLGEALLFHTGAVNRMGKIEEGNTVSDFEDEEIRRRLSLSTSVLALEYRDHKVNLLDTPGYTDFIGEVISALRASDAAILLVDSVAGVEVGTELDWGYCETFALPRFVAISKMDRENASFERALAWCVSSRRTCASSPCRCPWVRSMISRASSICSACRPGRRKARRPPPSRPSSRRQPARRAWR
jgi:elongation factor G